MTASYTSPHRDGLCQWRWHYSGADARCPSRALPGGSLCCDHLIDWTHEPGWSPTLPTTRDLIEARRTA